MSTLYAVRISLLSQVKFSSSGESSEIPYRDIVIQTSNVQMVHSSILGSGFYEIKPSTFIPKEDIEFRDAISGKKVIFKKGVKYQHFECYKHNGDLHEYYFDNY